MSKTLPPKIEAAKGERHHVFDWTVPVRLDGRRVTIVGSLDYEPPLNSVPTPLIVLLGLVVVGGGAAVCLRLRRERKPTHS